MRLPSSGVAPVSTVAVPPVSSTIMAVTPPVSTLSAGPRAAPTVSMVTVPAAPPSAVTPSAAAPTPVPAGARAPAAMAVAAPPAAPAAEAPPVTTGAPPAVAGAPSPPAVAVGAPPPAPAVGAPLSMGAAPSLLPAVPAPHHLFPPSLSVFLPVLSSPSLLCCSVFAQNLGVHAGFGQLLLFALSCLHSIHPAQDAQHDIIATRIRGLITHFRASLVLRAWRSRGFPTALLQQIAKQSLP